MHRAVGILLCAIGAPALSETTNPITDIRAPAAEVGVASTDDRSDRASVYSEDFEAFALGPIAGQFGWTTSTSGVKDIVDVSGVHPTFGSRTLKVVAGSSPGRAQVTFDPTPRTGFVEFDYDAGVADDTVDFHSFVDIFATGATFVVAKINWYHDGTIGVIQVVEGVGTESPTGATWTPNTIHRYRVEIDAGNVVRFFQDDVLIFTGHNINIESGGSEAGVNIFRAFNLDFATLTTTLLIDNISADDGVPSVVGDLTGDSIIDGADLAILLAAWGGTGAADPADLDGNGSVGGEDLAILLAAWTL